MRKKLWIAMALMVVLPGLLLTVSCAKKAVQSEPAVTETPSDTTQQPADTASDTTPQPTEQAQVDTEQLAAETAQREAMAARNMFMNEDIYFEFDSAALTPAAMELLRSKADWIRANPDAAVTIEGHCDERGTNAYNLALGERRAQAAKAYIVNMGIDAGQVATISYGEERPVDPAHNEEAWAKNRRGHFVIE